MFSALYSKGTAATSATAPTTATATALTSTAPLLLRPTSGPNRLLPVPISSSGVANRLSPLPPHQPQSRSPSPAAHLVPTLANSPPPEEAEGRQDMETESGDAAEAEAEAEDDQSAEDATEREESTDGGGASAEAGFGASDLVSFDEAPTFDAPLQSATTKMKATAKSASTAVAVAAAARQLGQATYRLSNGTSTTAYDYARRFQKKLLSAPDVSDIEYDDHGREIRIKSKPLTSIVDAVLEAKTADSDSAGSDNESESTSSSSAAAAAGASTAAPGITQKVVSAFRNAVFQTAPSQAAAQSLAAGAIARLPSKPARQKKKSRYDMAEDEDWADRGSDADSDTGTGTAKRSAHRKSSAPAPRKKRKADTNTGRRPSVTAKGGPLEPNPNRSRPASAQVESVIELLTSRSAHFSAARGDLSVEKKWYRTGLCDLLEAIQSCHSEVFADQLITNVVSHLRTPPPSLPAAPAPAPTTTTTTPSVGPAAAAEPAPVPDSAVLQDLMSLPPLEPDAPTASPKAVAAILSVATSALEQALARRNAPVSKSLGSADHPTPAPLPAAPPPPPPPPTPTPAVVATSEPVRSTPVPVPIPPPPPPAALVPVPVPPPPSNALAAAIARAKQKRLAVAGAAPPFRSIRMDLKGATPQQTGGGVTVSVSASTAGAVGSAATGTVGSVVSAPTVFGDVKDPPPLVQRGGAGSGGGGGGVQSPLPSFVATVSVPSISAKGGPTLYRYFQQRCPALLQLFAPQYKFRPVITTERVVFQPFLGAPPVSTSHAVLVLRWVPTSVGKIAVPPSSPIPVPIPDAAAAATSAAAAVGVTLAPATTNGLHAITVVPPPALQLRNLQLRPIHVIVRAINGRLELLDCSQLQCQYQFESGVGGYIPVWHAAGVGYSAETALRWNFVARFQARTPTNSERTDWNLSVSQRFFLHSVLYPHGTVQPQPDLGTTDGPSQLVVATNLPLKLPPKHQSQPSQPPPAAASASVSGAPPPAAAAKSAAPAKSKKSAGAKASPAHASPAPPKAKANPSWADITAAGSGTTASPQPTKKAPSAAPAPAPSAPAATNAKPNPKINAKPNANSNAALNPHTTSTQPQANGVVISPSVAAAASSGAVGGTGPPRKLKLNASAPVFSFGGGKKTAPPPVTAANPPPPAPAPLPVPATPPKSSKPSPAPTPLPALALTLAAPPIVSPQPPLLPTAGEMEPFELSCGVGRLAEAIFYHPKIMTAANSMQSRFPDTIHPVQQLLPVVPWRTTDFPGVASEALAAFAQRTPTGLQISLPFTVWQIVIAYAHVTALHGTYP